MERCYGAFQMLTEYIIPIVFFCAAGVTTELGPCDGKTAIDHHELEPVVLPSECLMRGSEDAAKYISDLKEKSPFKDMTFRIVCKRNSDKT
jgi:hypothetical protein